MAKRPMAVGLRAVAIAALSLAAVSAWAADERPLTALYGDPSQPDLSGLWLVTGGFFFSPDRKLPALKGEYKALYEKRLAAMNEGRPIDDVTADCLPAGVPHLLVVPYPFELVQTTGRVTLLYEYDSVVRRVPIGGTHADPNEVAATFNGDSVGRWEGDTLVVETRNIRADTQIDYTGLPHSDALVMVERIRRVDATTLENQVTLTDPKAFEAPFAVTRQYRLRPKWKISEYVCQENNRNKTDAEGRTGTGVPKP
jgi:hypothetical protein